MDVTGLLPGGSFLITAANPAEVFTPEDFSAEHALTARTLTAFLEAEVDPKTEELESHNFPLVRTLLRKLGQLGFLGVDIPEEYGGCGLDVITSLLVAEHMSRGSFSVSFGAHTVIGTLPIVYFGTEAQKRRYLPRMATGEIIGAYALTEPTAGSDALAARTRAVLGEDGRQYLLTGTKQFVSNAGFADVFVTYAKVDGERFTCFILDRDTDGLVVGAEEHKMGITGSSTASLFLDNARVPVEHVLGEIGEGHRVALNVLNVGRLKLGTGCLGAAKRALRQAVAYAGERHQFGRPIAAFGLIQHKLAEMALRIYLLESLIYRTGGLIHARRRGSESVVDSIEEYAVECSIAKVYGSEAVGFAADELVQIYGGYGFIEDYPAARAYRDARIARIYEGTNEINRLLIPGMLLRRAQRGRLPLLDAVRRASEEALSADLGTPDSGPLAEERHQVEMAKKAALLAAGTATQRHGEGIREHEEILVRIADLAIEVFALESALLRALKARERGLGSDIKMEMARLATHEGLGRIETLCRQLLAASAEGEALRTLMAALRRFLRYAPVDTIRPRRRIAERVLDAGGYVA
ncbi:MAG TPA: acyl-CoA dehydrogenase family protein [bacterium]|nr:acyl-CoA dehydrogenase family protein [bacterium]